MRHRSAGSAVTLVPVLAVLVAAACVRVNAVPLGPPESRPPVPADRVIVYRTPEQVPRSYVEVALIDTHAEWTWISDESKVVAEMRKKAGALGANALILSTVVDPRYAAPRVLGPVIGSPSERHGKAVAIVVAPPGTQRSGTR